MPPTFGTPLLRDSAPTEDAPMVERLNAADAIMLGKTNTPTFGSAPRTICSSVPAGFTEAGLPVGLQIVGPAQ